MESYTSERDQRDALRRFFIKYGALLIIGVVAGIVALIGWNTWRNHQNMLRMETESSWQKVSQALSTDKKNGVSAMEQFAGSNKNNYGALASLQLSVHFIDKNEFSKAEQQLRQSLSQTEDSNLLSLINLQLARIQLQKKNPDEALKTLSAVTDAEAPWNAMAQMIRGDARHSKGDVQGARDAYSDGLRFSASEGLTELLRMKLNNLPG